MPTFNKENKVKSNFERISIALASPEDIKERSSGEVLKPETVNYRTYKPERDGLFCEKIFGPTKDYECHCGKYKRIRYRGIVCDRCGVEVTEKKVRRERMGHIELTVPVAHIWYFKSAPNKIAALLGIAAKKLESVIYYEKYIVIKPGASGYQKLDLISEDEYLDLYAQMPEQYNMPADDPDKFVAGMGAEAIYELLKEIDVDALAKELRQKMLKETSQQRKAEALKRLSIVKWFQDSKGINRPEWMILKVIPVIPPDLRPLVPLDGGRFATSDLNDLYRRVIIRNNRLKRLIDIKAPEVILRNEKRMLQEAVDSLFDNSKKSNAVKSEANRALKSLSDSLKGKQGRFRQNLLGKRVDYSARSVIVVGPELKMHECGLPKFMAAELYKPFIIRKLIERGIVKTVKSAKKIVDRKDAVIWDILENVMKGHPVLLNRAPTLHRLGIQAFQPKMIEGKAIQLHPLACTAFNADFDGDQMAVHLPLSAEAQAEARFLMLAANNLLKPSDGRPVAVPSQDMVLGSYYLTMKKEEKDENGQYLEKGGGKVFRDVNEALMAYNEGVVSIHAPIKVRISKDIGGRTVSKLIECTVGRIIFNEKIPQNLGYVDRTNSDKQFDLEIDFLVKKGQLSDIVDRCIRIHGTAKTAEVLDDIKALGYKFSTRAAITVAVCDAEIPEQKKDILANADAKVEKINKLYKRGFISAAEKSKRFIDIWNKATDEVTDALKNGLDKYNPIFMMADSGARGSINQIRQLAGMRGLMFSATGKTMEIPIKSNFREGLTILEYFVAARSARKSLSDTALKTADSGYLTRRLVDVSHEVIIREHDCGTSDYMIASDIKEGNEVVEKLADRILGRYTVEDVINPQTGEVIVGTNQMITADAVDKIVKAGITEVKVRSVLRCKTKGGVCAHCYGMDLATSKPVNIGEAVGVIAAQSIGEPGTQLTMRTFHTGGIASDQDITAGLPRIEELFEARKPKGQAIVCENTGIARIIEATDSEDSLRHVIVKGEGGGKESTRDYTIPFTATLRVKDGDLVNPGDELTTGSVYPQDILRTRGVKGVQDYILHEVQSVYRAQGVEINDKHVEIIVRQMLRKVRVENCGDTDMLPGEMVDITYFEDQNAKVMEQGGRPATVKRVLLGITKASLATESFLSAASFQETARVLTEAAIKNKIDPLLGLKENVIIGKLIPAGTGVKDYKLLNPQLNN